MSYTFFVKKIVCVFCYFKVLMKCDYLSNDLKVLPYFVQITFRSESFSKTDFFQDKL